MRANEDWNPEQYLRYADQRLRPALELLSRIKLEHPKSIVDLGCGSGNVTSMLAQHWPQADILGLDNSPEMLKKARAEHPQINWQDADIASWQPSAKFDLIYSNAALHWLDDHRQLFPRLLNMLNAGGCLAVQMPANWKAPSHQLLREVLDECGGRELWTPGLRAELDAIGILPVEEYLQILSGNVKELDAWRCEYMQILRGDDAVFNWLRSTVVRPVLAHLSAAEAELFVADFKERLRRAYPQQPDGSTIFPFARLFLVVTV